MYILQNGYLCDSHWPWATPIRDIARTNTICNLFSLPDIANIMLVFQSFTNITLVFQSFANIVLMMPSLLILVFIIIGCTGQE